MNLSQNIDKYPPIFISSSDSYSDIWPIFFDLFKKNWPEYNGKIYLNTEAKTYSLDGLNIVCTQLGKQKSFGISFRKGLDLVKSNFVLIIMIDYIFMEKVNDKKVTEYYEYFKKQDLDTVNFQFFKSENQKDSENSDLVNVSPPAPNVFFNYQIALWKKEILNEMVLPNENPWTSEWYGTKRAEKMNLKIAIVKEKVGSPINYDPSGCLAKGKWNPTAVEFLLKEKIFVDFETRGYYSWSAPTTFRKRLKTKIMLVKAGLLGSYFDLLRRKPIH